MALFGTIWHFLAGWPTPIFNAENAFRLRREKDCALFAGAERANWRDP
jgi:hypothetical protein